MMKTQKILFSAIIALFVFVSCNEPKEVKKENVSLAISGMTCEIGCAKTIQSKLSKKEGVLNAKVVFIDSIATIEYDSNTTSKADLIAFVDGIAGGDMYSALETTQKAHACSTECKEKCAAKAANSGEKMACKADCKMACCADKTAENTSL